MNRTAAIFALVGLALLAGLFVVFRPDAPAPPPAVTPPVQQAAPPVTPARKVFELVVTGGRLTSGPEVIQVQHGDAVTLRVTADRADELHLHGYDLHVQLAPGLPSMLAFTADRSGRFAFELH